MANVLLKNNANIYVSTGTNATADANNTDHINVIDFSFNRGTIANDVSRDTLNPTQDRIVSTYIEAVMPVNFSLTTYMTPIDGVSCSEKNLWVGLLGSDSLTSSSLDLEVDFADGNVQSLNELTIWIHYPGELFGCYRLDNVIVDKATISLDINSMPQITWEGRALNISEDISAPTATDRTSTTSCLKNKISTIDLSVSAVDYTLALIGGSVVIDNNNVIYGRSKLGQVTTPQGHYSGNRTIKGNLEFYTKTGDSGSVESSVLYYLFLNATRTSNTYESSYDSAITINISGDDAPNVILNVPSALLDLGNQDFQPAITTTIGFTAQEGIGNYVTVTYQYPPATPAPSPGLTGSYFAGLYFGENYYTERYFTYTNIGTTIVPSTSYYPALYYPEHFYPERYFPNTNANTEITSGAEYFISDYFAHTYYTKTYFIGVD